MCEQTKFCFWELLPDMSAAAIWQGSSDTCQTQHCKNAVCALCSGIWPCVDQSPKHSEAREHINSHHGGTTILFTEDVHWRAICQSHIASQVGNMSWPSQYGALPEGQRSEKPAQASSMSGTQVKAKVTVRGNPRLPSNLPCINVGIHDLYYNRQEGYDQRREQHKHHESFTTVVVKGLGQGRGREKGLQQFFITETGKK